MKQKIMATGIGGIILIFLLFPQVVSDSAKEGLLMWFQVILPALLPFSIVSSVIIGLGLSEKISRFAAPVLCRVFGISVRGCYPVIIGLLSGYPLGAATVARLYQQGDISRQEAQYILHFCNNASPMFLVEFIGAACLGLHQPLVVLVIVYMAAWLGALCDRLYYRIRGIGFKSPQNGIPNKKSSSRSVISILDEGILHSFTMLTKVGGYIILFSILAGIIQQMCPLPPIWKAGVVCGLEITTGAVAMVAVGAGRLCNMLLIGFAAFGGLSSVAQSASVLSETDLSMTGYLLAKLRQAVFAMGIYQFVVSIF